MSVPVTELYLDEAVELGHAWVQAVADRHGIRILALKGSSLHRHGLRQERVSSDVDVLVDPARFAELCDAILKVGWVTRPGIFISHRTTLHSQTFIHENWPCDLDVHGYFPGFLADPAVVFDLLWERHVQMKFAHRECAVPDRISALIVLALHSLRGASNQFRHRDELEQLTRICFTAEEKADVASFALATGSVATLADVLPRLGVQALPSSAELASPELRAWRQRVASGSHGAYFWLLTFGSAPWWERPAVLWRAFWPSRIELRIAHPEIDGTPRSYTRARWRRWIHGITSAPAAVRAMLRHRR